MSADDQVFILSRNARCDFVFDFSGIFVWNVVDCPNVFSKLFVVSGYQLSSNKKCEMLRNTVCVAHQ